MLHCARPAAFARIRGDSEHENLHGSVLFYVLNGMVLVAADIGGLPVTGGRCRKGIHAMHIHSGGECSGSMGDEFAGAGAHFNPHNCEHPQHSGDMPPLFANEDGDAWCAFAASGFTIDEIIGKTVIIHEGVDDFTSQPAGNSGARIACGVIRRNV